MFSVDTHWARRVTTRRAFLCAGKNSLMKLSMLTETARRIVPISSLIMTKSELFEAVSNITRGYPAQTEGPVEVAYLEAAEAYQLVNGYHRVVELLVSGQDQVQVKVQDEHASWDPPPPDDTFVYQPGEQYGGLEDFIEPYLIRRL